MIMATLERENLFLAETPQAFQFDLIKEAYQQGMQKGLSVTDDAAMVEAMGFKVRLVCSTGPNPKLTTADEYEFIKMRLEGEKSE